MPLQSSCGSSLLENSIHSSRADFSSLHTQQGFGRSVLVSVLDGDLRLEARFVGADGWEEVAICSPATGEDDHSQPIVEQETEEVA